MLHQYYDEATAVAALRQQAEVALDSVAAAAPGHRRYDPEPGSWNWPAMASALAGVVHAPRSLPEDPALASLARQTLEQLTSAAEDVQAELQPEHAGWLTENGRAGLTALHRLCAAQLAYADYDGRRPGPRYVGYRRAAWEAAEATLLAADPEARDRPRGLHTALAASAAFSVTPADREARRAEAEAALDTDAHAPLQDAFFAHGQESLTHHRLYDRTHQPEKSWADTFRAWTRGAAFNQLGVDHHLRSSMRRPALLERLLPPLAAAEAASVAWLDGLAAGAQRPMVVMLEVSDYLWSEWSWLPAALLLTAPSVTIPARLSESTTRPRESKILSRKVLVLPEVAATALRDDEVAAVPVAHYLTIAELQQVAAALRKVPDGANSGVYRHFLELAVQALPTGGRR